MNKFQKLLSNVMYLPSLFKEYSLQVQKIQNFRGLLRNVSKASIFENFVRHLSPTQES
jgi:hypothetical protein